jgi:hypothetical protein
MEPPYAIGRAGIFNPAALRRSLTDRATARITTAIMFFSRLFRCCMVMFAIWNRR